MTTHTLLLQETLPLCKISSVTKKKKKKKKEINPLMVLVGINDRWVEMEIDTGAAVSLISHTVLDRFWPGLDKPKLSPKLAQKLVTYTGEDMTPCDTCEVTVTYDNQWHHLPLVVIPGSGPTLLGRNWLEVIQLSWERIRQLKAVRRRYPDVFKNELGGGTKKLHSIIESRPKHKIHLLQSTSCALCIAGKDGQRAGQAGVFGDNRTHTVFGMGSPNRCSP